MEIAFELVAVIRQKLFRGPVTHAGLEVEEGGLWQLLLHVLSQDFIVSIQGDDRYNGRQEGKLPTPQLWENFGIFAAMSIANSIYH